MEKSKKISKKKLEKLGKYIKKKNGIYVSSSDKLNYRLVKLENGLQIFLIQNKDTNIGSACMNVDVGSMDDTPGIDGIAHYLEHMLFMGSDMFPGGSYFLTQISNNGGHSNAFTSDDMTQYFFDCSENFLDLLRIFSRFFVSPSFDLKYVEKEVSAVDSEHKKNIGSDGWRISNLSKQFFTNEMYSHFYTGTKESILGACNNNPNILREKLIEFYEKYYSPDRMILFICYKDINDNIVDTIRSMFEPIKSKNNVSAILREEPIMRELKNKYEIIKALTTCATYQLTIKWLISGIATQGYQNNVCVDSYDILGHILGHESKGSLHHVLIDVGLIIGMSAGVEKNYETKCIYSLYLDLTQKGIENWENILYLVNNYVRNLEKINDKNGYMFDQFLAETEALNIINLKTMINISGLQLSQHYIDVIKNMRIDTKYVPIAPVLSGSHNLRKKHFTQLLKQMTFEKMKIVVSSPFFNENDLKLVDINYGTKYAHEQLVIKNNIVNKVYDLFDETQYPSRNKYIPHIEKIKNINPVEKNNNDYCVLHSQTNNVYYLKKGNTYKTYNICGIFEIKILAMEKYDPLLYIAILLYIAYMDKIMRSEIYMLQMINTMLSIYVNKCDLVLIYNGCSEKIEDIFFEVMEWYFVDNDKTKHLNLIDRNIYEMIYHDFITDLENYQFSDAYTMIGPEFKKMVNCDHTFSNEQLINELKKLAPKKMENERSTINYNNFREYIINVITNGDVIGAIGGSINIDQAKKIIKTVDMLIKKPKKTMNKTKYTLDPSSFPNKKIIQNINPHNSEKAIGYGLWIGNALNYENIFPSEHRDNNDILKSLCKILETYISDKFTSLVRTEQEIGYIAMCVAINVNEPTNPELFLLFIAQSTRNDLEAIVKHYIDNQMMNDIYSMTDGEFNYLKFSLMTHLSEKALNINADVHEMYGELKNRKMNNDEKNSLNETEKLVQKHITMSKLKKIEKKHFVEFVKNIFDRNVRSVVVIDPMIEKLVKKQ